MVWSPPGPFFPTLPRPRFISGRVFPSPHTLAKPLGKCLSQLAVRWPHAASWWDVCALITAKWVGFFVSFCLCQAAEGKAKVLGEAAVETWRHTSHCTTMRDETGAVYNGCGFSSCTPSTWKREASIETSTKAELLCLQIHSFQSHQVMNLFLTPCYSYPKDVFVEHRYFTGRGSLAAAPQKMVDFVKQQGIVWPCSLPHTPTTGYQPQLKCTAQIQPLAGDRMAQRAADAPAATAGLLVCL